MLRGVSFWAWSGDPLIVCQFAAFVEVRRLLGPRVRLLGVGLRRAWGVFGGFTFAFALNPVRCVE